MISAGGFLRLSRLLRGTRFAFSPCLGTVAAGRSSPGRFLVRLPERPVAVDFMISHHHKPNDDGEPIKIV